MVSQEQEFLTSHTIDRAALGFSIVDHQTGGFA